MRGPRTSMSLRESIVGPHNSLQPIIMLRRQSRYKSANAGFCSASARGGSPPATVHLHELSAFDDCPRPGMFAAKRERPVCVRGRGCPHDVDTYGRAVGVLYRLRPAYAQGNERRTRLAGSPHRGCAVGVRPGGRPPTRPHPDSAAAVRRACEARPPFVALSVGRPQPVEDADSATVRVYVVRATTSTYAYGTFTLRREHSGAWAVIERRQLMKVYGGRRASAAGGS